MTGRHIFGATAALALALPMASCVSGNVPGEAARLAFSYDTDAPRGSLSSPIAIGARITLRAADVSTSTPLPIITATSDSAAVVVLGIEDGGVLLEGAMEGTARITVAATLRDEPVVDTIVLESQPAARLSLEHACAGGESGVYLTGSRVRLPLELASAEGRPLIGHGFHPVTFDPGGRLTIDESSTSEAFLPLRSGQLEGVVTIASSIDDERLSLELIDEGRISGAELLGGSIDNAVAIGETRFAIVAPLFDGRRLCQGEPEREITTDTPALCTVAPITRATEDAPRQGLVSIRGIAQGTCRFTVRFPTAADGSGLEVPFGVPVR